MTKSTTARRQLARLAVVRYATHSHPTDYNAPMRYRLRTLLILLALGGVVLVAMWYFNQTPQALIGWTAFVAFFAFWYWRLRKAQSLHPRTRGYPRDDSSTGAAV